MGVAGRDMAIAPEILGKGWLAGMVLAALLIPAQGVAQPVIKAPDQPARMAPQGQPLGSSFNSFVASDRSSPKLEDVAPMQMLPVVVELFTSQGCSSCPPADAMMAKLLSDPGVLPLSFHVDYWDYLGWADGLARPEFTARQEAYAQLAGERALYTPQLIVNGRDTAVAPGPAQLKSLIDAHRMSPAMVSVTRENTPEGDRIAVMPLSDLGGPVDLWMVRYAPERQVRIMAGENRGREMRYTNVALSVERIAGWDGEAPLRMMVRGSEAEGKDYPPDTRHVLLVQSRIGAQNLPGKILAAIDLD